MKATITLILPVALAVVAATTLPADNLPYSGGPPNDRACAPPFYASCVSCHASFPLESGQGSVVIEGVPAVYTPGSAYDLSVVVSDPAATRWGFELTAMDDQAQAAGSLVPIDAETQVHNSPSAEFVKHTFTGTAAGTPNGHRWTFRWVAPAASTGTVRFYAAGNAANNNFSTTGDQIYCTATASAPAAATQASLVLQPDTTRPRLGSTWTIRARVREHAGANQSLLLVSRVRLANGSFFPAQGWLQAPVSVIVAPEGLESASLVHQIPLAAPLQTVTYEAFLGQAPGTLVALDSFEFTLTP